MDIVVLDWETFYGDDYTLSKMTTEEYVRDPRFETILVSIKINREPAFWVPQPNVAKELSALHLERNAMLAHHIHFDGLIAYHHYGISPRLMLCTLGMARHIHGANARLSLAKLAERYGVGVKGEEVHNVKGMHFADFDRAGLIRYGDYSCQDANLERDIFDIMAPCFSREEFEIHDHVIRMFTEPEFVLDAKMLEKYAAAIRAEKVHLMLQAGVTQSDLMSNEKFAETLRNMGIEPPMKISKTTGKPTYAFAKTDLGMQQLQEHPDERVQILAEARLKNKTTLAERGAERLVRMASRGPATVYLKYSGASGTHRLSGGDKFNWQSMKRGSDLRNAVMAPEGYVVVVADSSTIEARLLDWLSGQDDMVDVYRKQDNKTGPDMYCVIGGRIYGRIITKENDPDERQMGKVCVAEGTPVLTRRGWVPIEQIQLSDQVWDGESWVYHLGLLNNGTRETLSLSGLWLTPDHLVWSGTQWWEAQSVAADAAIHSQALAFAAASLPSPDTYVDRVGALPRCWSHAAVDGLSIPSTHAIFANLPALDAEPAPMPLRPVSDIGSTPMRYQIPRSAFGYSTVLAQQLHAVITRAMRGIRTTAAEVSACAMNGIVTAPLSYAMCNPFPDGTTPYSIWTGATPTGTTNQGISGLLPVGRTHSTNARSEIFRQKSTVYDIACCGPNQRFTVLSGAGPVIVHNCKLGLGFGMGAEKFVFAVRAQAKVNVLDANGEPIVEGEDEDGKLIYKKKPLVITPAFAKEVVDIYRNGHPQVRKLWRRGDKALEAISNGQTGLPVDFRGIVKTIKDGLELPGGIKIMYPDLKRVKVGQGDSIYDYEWEFWNGKMRERIYGAKVIENIIQCLARITVFRQCLDTAKETRDVARWKHSMHDEGIFISPHFEAPWVLEVLMKHMRTPPNFAPDLPVNCEGGFNVRYGKAKK